MLKLFSPVFLFCYYAVLSTVNAQSFETLFDACLIDSIKTADKNQTLKQIEDACEKTIVKKHLGSQAVGAISERMIKERKSAFDPYVITPHKMNYLLPVSITDNINKNAYNHLSGWSEHIKDVEAKFQLSIKVPLFTSTFLTTGDQLFFGFTLVSWWQLYTEDLSRPFRETNYQPELFYFAPLNWHPFETNTAVVFGIEHQSNGRSQQLSRSWNRVYANFLFEKENIAVSFRPWYKLPEDDKMNANDAVGDDNPDIDKYMGHFELGIAYKWQSNYEFSLTIRESFAHHHGAFELGATFPLWGKLQGYAQYFNGYGESLIDYNHKQQRIGIGIALTNLL